jgi:hypothetical protein
VATPRWVNWPQWYKRFDGSFHSADVVAARELLEAGRII